MIAEAVAVGDAHAAVKDVTEGSIIKAVHIDFWVLNEAASGLTTQFTAILEKVVSGEPGAIVSELLNLQGYDNKKNILHSFQGNLAPFLDGQGTMPFMQGWFKIPKGKQRMGNGDKIILSMTPVGQAVRICGLSTYKEYQ